MPTRPSHDPQRPLVVVCNISEAFYPFLNRAPHQDLRTQLILGEQYRGDRALMWLGPSKLVVVSHPIAHAEDFSRQFGYQETHYMAPKSPSPWLCQDILNEPHLLQALVDYAGPTRIMELIPYASTSDFYRLVDRLRMDYGLQVVTPESPEPSRLWVRDYIDTKMGFHVLVSQWLKDSDNLLPRRIICHHLDEAAAAVQWFGDCGLDCLIKADDGENGIGNFLVTAGSIPTIAATKEHLRQHSFLDCDEVVIEEYIRATRTVSPSLELFVPPLGDGEPEITYVSEQIFLGPGDFCGVIVDRGLLEKEWYADLEESGCVIANHLQEMGYVGHFDLDAIIDDNDHLYLLEVNARRTGGTHVHEVGTSLFGPGYLNKVVLLSHDSLSSAGINDYEELRTVLSPCLYPQYNNGSGMIFSVTSSLSDGEFGAIFVGRTSKEVLALQEEITRILEQYAAST